jgi:hypothetical protein
MAITKEKKTYSVDQFMKKIVKETYTLLISYRLLVDRFRKHMDENLVSNARDRRIFFLCDELVISGNKYGHSMVHNNIVEWYK